MAEDAFQTLAAGESVEAEFDPAEVHDLSTGGDFDFLVRGTFLTASADSTAIDGFVPFDSNLLKSHVDGAAAGKVRRDFTEAIQKRTVIQSDCTGTRGTAQRTALTNCAAVARRAATAATSGAAAKLTEYFKSSTSATRSTVAAVFNAAATECGSTTSGVSTQYCTDVLGYCTSQVLAYTVPAQSLMVSCPLYFSALTGLSSQCHAQDQATTTLHETTHLRQIKGTADNGYGYTAIQGLSSAQSLNNADSYALFANGMFLFFSPLHSLAQAGANIFDSHPGRMLEWATACLEKSTGGGGAFMVYKTAYRSLFLMSPMALINWTEI